MLIAWFPLGGSILASFENIRRWSLVGRMCSMVACLCALSVLLRFSSCPQQRQPLSSSTWSSHHAALPEPRVTPLWTEFCETVSLHKYPSRVVSDSSLFACHRKKGNLPLLFVLLKTKRKYITSPSPNIQPFSSGSYQLARLSSLNLLLWTYLVFGKHLSCFCMIFPAITYKFQIPP